MDAVIKKGLEYAAIIGVVVGSLFILSKNSCNLPFLPSKPAPPPDTVREKTVEVRDRIVPVPQPPKIIYIEAPTRHEGSMRLLDTNFVRKSGGIDTISVAVNCDSNYAKIHIGESPDTIKVVAHDSTIHEKEIITKYVDPRTALEKLWTDYIKPILMFIAGYSLGKLF